MRALLVALLITCAGMASAAAADEGTLVATPRFVPAAGPLPAGPGGVAWVSRRDDRTLDLWIAEPGQGPRRVQRFAGSDGERLRDPRLSASASDVGLRLRVTDGRGRTLRRLAYAGAFGQPLRPGEAPPARADARDGRSVALTRACESAEIRTGTAPPLEEPACELRLRSPLRLRGDRLLLGISCAGFAIDCSARVVVRAGGRVVARGPARYNRTTPPYAAASLRVGPAARKLLRAGRRVRVTARIDAAVTRHTIVQLPAARR